jgi:hypothetical protein
MRSSTVTCEACRHAGEVSDPARRTHRILRTMLIRLPPSLTHQKYLLARRGALGRDILGVLYHNVRRIAGLNVFSGNATTQAGRLINRTLYERTALDRNVEPTHSSVPLRASGVNCQCAPHQRAKSLLGSPEPGGRTSELGDDVMRPSSFDLNGVPRNPQIVR